MTDAMAVFQPETMGGMMKAAEQLSRSSLIPRALQNKPGDVLVVLLTGREFGLGPMQAMRSIHVVEGKPTMAADLMVGLCLARREVCEVFSLVESTKARAVYKTKRVGNPEVTLEWTIQQAQAAGVVGKDNWKKYPEAMLRARCASALARAVYPDLLAGVYDPDELGAPVAAPARDTSPPEDTRPPPVPALPEPAPRDALEAKPTEKVPVVVFEQAVPKTSPREPGEDDDTPADGVDRLDMLAEAICAEAGMVATEEERKALCNRAAELPAGSEQRRRSVKALNAAKARINEAKEGGK